MSPQLLTAVEISRAVLLDIDGTLLDSNEAHARAWTTALDEGGHPVSFAFIRALIGMGGDKLLRAAGVNPESRDGRAIVQRKQELFAAALPDLSPTPGARTFVEVLRREAFSVIVASAAKAEEVRPLLKQAGVADLITDTNGNDATAKTKPDPDVINAALRRFHISHHSAVMVGDTPYDIESAGRAGVPTIALRCGGWWADDALSGAVAIYDDPQKLAQCLIGTMNRLGSARRDVSGVGISLSL